MGPIVYHRLDPLKVAGTVVEEFAWFGQRKLVVQMQDGTFAKDWKYEWIESLAIPQWLAEEKGLL